MTKRRTRLYDLPLICLLGSLAVMIWCSCLGQASANDLCLCSLALFLFVGLGRPWRFRAEPAEVSPAALVVSSGSFLAGLATGSLLLLAIGWSALLWAWLDTRIADERKPDIRRLLFITLFVFPWMDVDCKFLGWWMRLSSATASEYVLALAGPSVSREGTILYVNGQPVSVTEACGGMETLHAMIVVGLAAAYVHLGPKTAIWKWLPALFALAWCANTLRILCICIGARYFGTDLVQNALHDLGGWLIVGAMIALCVLFFSCWRRIYPLWREPARIRCVGGTNLVRRFCQGEGRPGVVLWSMLAVSIIVGSVWRLCPLPDAQERLRRLVRVTERTHGRDVPITESERERLGEATAVRRVCDVGGAQFTVTAIDGTRNRRVVHDPTYCWTVTGSSEMPVDGGTAKMIRVVENGREKEMMYWFSDGTVRHASPIRYLGQTAVRRMTLGWAGREPILVLVEPCEARTVNWFRFIDDFPTLFKI